MQTDTYNCALKKKTRRNNFTSTYEQQHISLFTHTYKFLKVEYDFYGQKSESDFYVTPEEINLDV